MSGFTLWPSRVHNVTIAATRYEGGAGDVVASFRKSCAHAAIAAGFFYSAHCNWVLGMDTFKMGHPRLYGGPPLTAAEYEAAALAQLRELAAYGSWAEVWWDAGIFLPLTPHIPALVREVFPNAMCHSCSPFTESAPGAGHGRGIRWVGNEEGTAPLPSWAASGTDGRPPGDPEGPVFSPASCDTVLEEHYWFAYPGDEAFLRSTCALSNVYLTSVGRATNLILNMAPLPSGGIAAHEVAAYAALGDAVACMWRAPIAAWEGVSVNLVTGVASLPLHSPHTCAAELGCELSLVLQEELASAGQRLGVWTIKARDVASGTWGPALSPSIPANATIGVGHKRIVVVRIGSGSSAPVTFDALRVVVATAYAAVADASAPLMLAHVALYDRAAGVQGCAALHGCTLVEY